MEGRGPPRYAERLSHLVSTERQGASTYVVIDAPSGWLIQAGHRRDICGWLGRALANGFVRGPRMRLSPHDFAPFLVALRPIISLDSPHYTFYGQRLSLIHISEPTRQAEISYAVF